MKTTNENIRMKEADWEDFNNATNCFLCGCKFEPEDKKVRDHCHFTLQYMGCAHYDCNLQFSMRFYQPRNDYNPVFAHDD